MVVSIYVDGSGGPNSAYGYFVMETGKSFYKIRPGLTNNQAEYMAIVAALKEFDGSDEEITVYSDSKVVVAQLNHEYAINKGSLRQLARQAWVLIGRVPNIKLQWIPREKNMAGKMLSS